MRALLLLCHAALIGMARQVIGVSVIVVLFSIFYTFSVSLEVEITREASAAMIWQSASPYLAASFVVVAFGIALTSGVSVNRTADRIARLIERARLRRPKQVLVGVSVQFGLGSILMAILTLRTPCEMTSILHCFLNPIYNIIWAAALSMVTAGCGANAHAIAKASTMIPDIAG